MAIYIRCTKCKCDHKQGIDVCRKCGSTLATNRTYKVVVYNKQTDKRVIKLVDTLTLAKRVESKYKGLIAEGRFFENTKAPLISDIWEQYANWATVHKQKSCRHDIGRWENHVKKHVAGKHMDQLIPHDVQNILDKMVIIDNVGLAKINQKRKEQAEIRRAKENKTKKEPAKKHLTNSVPTKETSNKKHAPATIKHVLVLIKRVYNWANEQGLYKGFNPANIKPPKVQNEITKSLDKSDLAELLEIIVGWKNRLGALVVKFALYTGFRLDEVLGLKWEHVDIDKGFIRLYDPKGNPTTLPIGGEALNILKSVKELSPYDGCPYVFPNNKGQRRVSFHKIWSGIRKKAGISKDFRFHDLRHTFASYLANSGEVDLYTLQKLLNHQTPKMTQRYAHLCDDILRKGAKVGDRVLVSSKTNDKT